MNEELEAAKPNGSGEKAEKKESFFDLLRFGLIAALIVLPIRMFIAQPFIVSGASMVPAFDDGHYLIIDELSYRFSEPKRGDVVVFRFPFEPKKFLIKRVIGLPGETVELNNATIVIKNSAFPDGFVFGEGETSPGARAAEQTVALGKGEYFVLGDNRGQSMDSRIWGALPRDFIIGTPLARLFPFSKIGLFPGEWSNAAE